MLIFRSLLWSEFSCSNALYRKIRILSNKSQTALDDGGLVIYVLTALLCTLVAVSIILIGCAERTKETERHIRSLGANITKSHDELLRVGRAGLRANEQISAKITATGDNQESLRTTIKERADHLGGRISDVTAAQEQFGDHVDGLRKLIQAVAGDVTNIAREQTTLHETVETGSVESIARNQDNIDNAVSGTCQESLSKLDAITDGQEHWGRQLEANEAQVNAMVANIGNLQQQIAAVLEMLNTCVQSLTDVLDSNNKHQFKLEDTINQNLTSIAELISQIKANRACLQAQF